MIANTKSMTMALLRLSLQKYADTFLQLQGGYARLGHLPVCLPGHALAKSLQQRVACKVELKAMSFTRSLGSMILGPESTLMQKGIQGFAERLTLLLTSTQSKQLLYNISISTGHQDQALI